MNLCGLCNGDHLAVEFAVRDSEDDVDGVIDTQKAGVDHEVVGIAGSPDLVETLSSIQVRAERRSVWRGSATAES